jgi:nitrite reductase/ring-hydroxylating ferredoxin subunit
MSWIKVLESTLAPGDRQVVNVGDKKVLVLNHQGQYFALDNACPHLNLPLKKGKITDDGAIVCPFHRTAFDLTTGAVKVWTPWPPVVGQVLGKISTEKAIAVFPVKVEANSIWVDA